MEREAIKKKLAVLELFVENIFFVTQYDVNIYKKKTVVKKKAYSHFKIGVKKKIPTENIQQKFMHGRKN